LIGLPGIMRNSTKFRMMTKNRVMIEFTAFLIIILVIAFVADTF